MDPFTEEDLEKALSTAIKGQSQDRQDKGSSAKKSSTPLVNSQELLSQSILQEANAKEKSGSAEKSKSNIIYYVFF